jgi:hypothetical protein
VGINSSDVQEIRSSPDELPCPVMASNALAPPSLWSSSRIIEGTRGVSQSPIDLPGQLRCRGQLVPHSPQELHLHPALARLNLAHSIIELNLATRLKGLSMPEPISDHNARHDYCRFRSLA